MHRQGTVEGGFAEGQCGDVALGEVNGIQSLVTHAAGERGQHVGGDVDAEDFAAGCRDRQCDPSGADAEFQHPGAFADLGGDRQSDGAGNFGRMPAQRIVLPHHALIKAVIQARVSAHGMGSL